jgi:hypothetical protein
VPTSGEVEGDLHRTIETLVPTVPLDAAKIARPPVEGTPTIGGIVVPEDSRRAAGPSTWNVILLQWRVRLVHHVSEVL